MNTLRNIDAVNLPTLTWQAQGDANEYVIKTPDNWLATLQMNGDPSKAQQESIMNLFVLAPELYQLMLENLWFAELVQRGKEPTSWLVKARALYNRIEQTIDINHD